MLWGILSGCSTTESAKNYNVSVARFVMENSDENGYAGIAEMPVSRVRIPVNSSAVLSEFDIVEVSVMEVELGKCLLFALTPQATRAFVKDSSLNRGKRLVLLVNGRPLGVRRIDTPIVDGRIFMFLETKDENLDEIAKDIKKTSLDAQKRLKK